MLSAGAVTASLRLHAATTPGEAPNLPGPHDGAAAAAAGRQAGPQESNASTGPRSAGGHGLSAAAVSAPSFARYRVYATQYVPNTNGSVEVAVPDKCVKFAALGDSHDLSAQGCAAGYTLGANYSVIVQRDNGASATIPVKDTGPWNIDDNYWDPAGSGPRPRRLYGDLPQGTPESQAAFYNGYNTASNCKNLDGTPSNHAGGADQFGRCVLNPSGIDLSTAAASQLGIGGSEWVTVTYLWEPAVPISKPAVIRGNTWYLRQSLTSGGADFSFGFGNAGDKPLMCDWNGDGVKTPGVYRNGWFYLRNSESSGTADVAFPYGNIGDTPICGDWNGNGTDTVGVVRGNIWYLRNSNTSGTADVVFAYGNTGDKPIVGDWNADGTTTPGVVRGNTWYLRNTNSSGAADVAFAYGDSTDVPVVGDWNGDHAETPGVRRGNTWYVRNSNTSGVADVSFSFGDTGDIPRVWR